MSNGTYWQELLGISRTYSGQGKALGLPDSLNRASLQLAVDTCYFAMYHGLCRSNAHSPVGRNRKRYPEDWRRVYTGMTEDSIAERFRQHRPQACDAVKEISSCFAIIQEHRDRAMARAFTTFVPLEVANLIDRAESAILGLLASSTEEQKSLAINLLIGSVRGNGPRTHATPGAPAK